MDWSLNKLTSLIHRDGGRVGLITRHGHAEGMTDSGLERQFRKPEGEDGRTVLERMNEHHAPLWDFCLDGMPKAFDGSVLDIGCGGGGFLRRLSRRYPYAMLFGADISEEALAMTAEVNTDLIGDGGLELRRASVDDLPFGDGSFDMVTAMETYFFWPDFASGIGEIARVMSPGGVLAIGSELRYDGSNDGHVDKMCQTYGMRILRDEEIVRTLEENGFSVRVKTGEPGVLYRAVKGV